jgi:hypothetical protein
MNLVYTHSHASAHDFAQHNDLAPGDWKWISDKDVVAQHPRADVYLGPGWQRHPRRAEIDEALEHARHEHRLGTVTDLGSTLGTLGVSST